MIGIKAIREMAEKDPKNLVDLIKNGRLELSDLTFAVEYIGDCISSDEAYDILGSALKNKNPTVREGALYGLAYHIKTDKIKDLIRETSISDKNITIRGVAKEILEEAE